MDIYKKFGLIKAGYSINQLTKPKNGNLYLDGKLYLSNLPFSILQYWKSKLKNQGYTSKRISIKYN